MYNYKCSIVRVVDGDTLIVDIDLGFSMWLKNISVRLMGINAPESRTTDLKEKAEGIKSKNYLATLLAVGSIQTIHTVIDKEKFGRVLADFSLLDEKGNSFSLCSKIVEEGHASYHSY